MKNRMKFQLTALTCALASATAFNNQVQADDCITMEVSTLVGGDHGSWTITNLAPDDRFVVMWSTRIGKSVIDDRRGYCATFGIRGINRKRIVGEGQADANGVGIIDREIPSGRAGITIYTQAAKRFTCPDECISNIVESTLQ